MEIKLSFNIFMRKILEIYLFIYVIIVILNVFGNICGTKKKKFISQ